MAVRAETRETVRGNPVDGSRTGLLCYGKVMATRRPM